MDKKTKKCENQCPKCGAGITDIEWGVKDLCDSEISQSAICLKCGCHFTEYYGYTETEYDPDEDSEPVS